MSLSDLPARIAAAKPDAFVEVVTLRREVYDRIRSRIRDLPGTVFQEETLHLAPTRAFARALIGTVGDVLKEQMDAKPGKYLIGDQVGQSGLQEQYDDLLRGTPGVSVLITRPAGEGTPRRSRRCSGPTRRTGSRCGPRSTRRSRTRPTRRWRPRRSGPRWSRSGSATARSSRWPTGRTAASSTSPSRPRCRRAPRSRWSPRSACSTRTRSAWTRPVNCPQTFTVEGRSFNNSGNFVLGAVPFRVDFAKSCNTAFASLAPKLGGGRADEGGRVGGHRRRRGTSGRRSSPARSPTNASAVEAAAAAFGQGTTQVSPVALAGRHGRGGAGLLGAAEAVRRAPAHPAPPPRRRPAPLNAASVAGAAHDDARGRHGGHGAALGDVPGGPVYAKTGTAEFDDTQDKTHAWTIGWQGDVAFAVFVENGGTSSATAVPIVEKFLRGL